MQGRPGLLPGPAQGDAVRILAFVQKGTFLLCPGYNQQNPPGLFPGARVLLSSGYSINGQATEILNRGCNGFIQKPFRIEALSQKLREILDKEEGGVS
ncbi:MAG TPA: hypothetical protein ENH37_09265 [Deltaproteobacteria bacterium]|nr:hypothetical protein [Deltaproteobacteria bacterium]HDZ90850.1 hypothetical protein [Deltaproteobacteria bacterium]